MKVVAFVPIKLNNQRLPGKNLLPIGDKPMCWYIVNSLINTKGIDETYVYCSNNEICKHIPEKAIFLKRPKSLDGNLVKGFEIYTSFINTIDADIYVLAHATSPFTKSVSISNALSHVLSGENDSAFSAERIQTFVWYKNQPINYDLKDVPRTQDMEPIFKETSAFYIFKKEIFTEFHRRIGFNPYIQEMVGIEAVDVDEKKDYDMAVSMFNASKLEN